MTKPSDGGAFDEDALLAALLEAAPEPPSDFVPGTLAPPTVQPLPEPTDDTPPSGSALPLLDDASPNAETLWNFDEPSDTPQSRFRRASFLELEARSHPSAAAAARGLLLASELWVELGEPERAAAAAQEAVRAAPNLTLAHTQLRAVSPRALGDTKSHELWVESLQTQARLGSDDAARAHAAWLLGDLLRTRGDLSGAARAEDIARRRTPQDLRAQASELCERLVQGESPLTVHLPADHPLRAAALRVAELTQNRETADATPSLLLERARRHLAQGRWATAAESLMSTAAQGIAPSALLDVAASLTAHTRSERPLALRALRRRIEQEASRPALRTLAARALEQRDSAALNDAIERADPASGTFELSERLVLLLLAGSPFDLAELDLDALATRSDPSVATAFAASSGSHLGSSPSAVSALLGSLIASQQSDELFLLLESLADDSPLRHLLTAELALAAQDADGAAHALVRLAEIVGSAELFEAAGLLYEARQHSHHAAEAYTHAHELSPELHRVRALGETSRGVSIAGLLSDLAEKQSEPKEAALLYLEAALCADPTGAQALLERAFEHDSLGTIVPWYGSFEAARAGDHTRRREWLRRGREQARTPDARGLALLREVVATAEHERAPLAGLVASLATEYPKDWPLQELSEHLNDASPSDRARRRLAVPQPTAASAAWLAAEATLLAFCAGDVEVASRGVRQLQQIEATPFTTAFAGMLAEAGGDGTEHARRLLTELGENADKKRRAEALERLATLDEARGDRAGYIEWQRALLVERPDHLWSLVRLERELLDEGKPELLEPVAKALAKHLPLRDAAAYRLWLGAGRLLDGDLRAARHWLEALTDQSPAPTLALRAVETHARQIKDDQTLLRISTRIASETSDPGESAAAWLEAALASARLGERAKALAGLDRARANRPDDLVATWLRAELLKEAGLPELAANSLSNVAQRLRVPEHRLGIWLEVGRLWLEADVGGSYRDFARFALHQAQAIDPAHDDVFHELRKLASESGDLRGLIELLDARRQHAASLDERTELEESLASCFRSLGDLEQERAALERWLALEPEAASAWRSHAEVCTQLTDYSTAKSSWLRFLESNPEAASRDEAQKALAVLYDEHLNDPKAAVRAFKEVLTSRPGDLEVMSSLVRSYSRLGAAEPAIQLQTKVVQLASTPSQKRDGALLLARLYEELASDVKRAAATLERTRRAWPLDPAPLAALVELMQRHGEESQAHILLERISKEVSQKLESERIEPGLLELLATIAELRDQEELKLNAQSARKAWLGQPDERPGAGSAALASTLDERIAPPELAAPLRTLLQKVGRVLDEAFPVHPESLGATAVRSGAPWSELQAISRAIGLGEAEVFCAPSLGARCLPARGPQEAGGPYRVLIGPKLEELAAPLRSFLILRSIKLVLSGGGALARSRPEDTWPMLAALLHLFAPGWIPPEVDQSKFLLARAQLEKGLRAVGYDDDVPFLVLEAIGSLTQQSSHFGEAARLLANRAALLGTGALGAAFEAFACLGERRLALEGPSRWRWLNGHAEARDLALFCASKAYSDARIRLGLAPEPAERMSRLPSLPPKPPERLSRAPAPPPPPRRT